MLMDGAYNAQARSKWSFVTRDRRTSCKLFDIAEIADGDWQSCSLDAPV